MLLFSMFENETGLNEILKTSQKVFDDIEQIQELLKTDKITSPDDYAKYLNILTGYYMYLDRIASVAEAYEDIKEAEEILKAKNSAIAEGHKPPSDETAKCIAKTNIANYIRIANLFRSYTRITDKAILTMQSQLKRFYEEEKYKPSTI